MRHRDRTLWAAIALFYAGTRAALLWRFPPHVDESLYATWTAAEFDRTASLFIPLSRGQQPLLEWIAVGFMHLGAGPLLAVRLVSFFAGLGTLALIGALGRRLGGRSTSLVAGALFAVLPFFLVYTVIGLYDPLATLFVTAAVVLLISVAEQPRLGTALLLGIALGGGLLTKLTTELSLALVPLGALFFDWSREDRRRRLRNWLLALAGSAAIAWAMYQILRLSTYYGTLGAARRVFARHSVGSFLDHPGHWLATNGGSYGHALVGYLTIPVIVAVGIGLLRALQTTRALAILLGTWATLPLVAAVTLADVPYVRWIDTGMPAAVLLGAFGTVTAFSAVRRRRLGKRTGRAALATLAVVLAVPALAWDARTLATPLSRVYPGSDDVDYVRGASAGGPWLRLAPDLRRLSRGQPLVIAWSGREAREYVQLALRHDSQITLVAADAPEAARARYGFANGTSLTGSGNALGWRQIRTYSRPRGGVPVTLYERDVR